MTVAMLLRPAGHPSNQIVNSPFKTVSLNATVRTHRTRWMLESRIVAFLTDRRDE